ncbi:RNA polymerase, sigma subunit, SigV [Desulfonispora thiosulfatigenes DSM 11270]|uniref:RNA polymerase, sigma subunit, SigV n=1 Tax=Desulfonispora thiosulfatigenes DSM 11270 TaxID=656914 RepID=A0A1W1UXP9_DESTI|nr:sigma-70 family RNA polymerase sigma factor [Desulfonispora thiosulfatigenes]SMB85862.1 RNA polymerase, sigma subunit, SigV [Desulfonispora thiosulfatigenes DSM 11270]
MVKKDLKQDIADHVVTYKESHYRLAYSYVKNVEDALDIVQESIYKAFSASGSLQEPGYIKTWFYRIIVNTSLDFLRKKKKIVILDNEILTNLDLGEADNYEDFDLKVALDSLAEPYRTIIILRYFEDLKIEEIAEVLDENVNTIKTRLYKGLEKLRIKMNDDNLYEEA